MDAGTAGWTLHTPLAARQKLLLQTKASSLWPSFVECCRNDVVSKQRQLEALCTPSISSAGLQQQLQDQSELSSVRFMIRRQRKLQAHYEILQYFSRRFASTFVLLPNLVVRRAVPHLVLQQGWRGRAREALHGCASPP